MSILFDDARSSTRPHGRSTTGLWISIVLHAVVTVVVIVGPIGASETPPAPRRPSKMVFIMPATALVSLPPVRLVAPRLPAPPPPKRELIRAEAPKPLPVEPVVASRVEPPPAPIVRVPAPALVEKPVIQRPPETGLFERTTGVRTSQAAAAVTTGGFGTATTSPRATVDSAVTTGGFGTTAASPRDVATGGVKTGGFGTEAPAPRRIAHGEVQTSGFDQRASAPAQPSVAVTKPIDQPVEITFKPTPEYTDEARSARIEGTVSLELEFTAAGDVRVLRVVRGLGHGLDEAAQRAALRIRFKPAQSDGRPVDSRATVHITFRLS
jgi:TonB family protein